MLAGLKKWAAFWMLYSDGVNVDGGGWGITPDGKPIPIDEWGPLRVSREAQSALVGADLTTIAELLDVRALRKALFRARRRHGRGNIMTKALEELLAHAHKSIVTKNKGSPTESS